MKKAVCILSMVFILAGCSEKSTPETLGNACSVEPVLEPAQIIIDLPDQFGEPVLHNENEDLYLSEQYAVFVQTLSGGDINKTINLCTGYSAEELTIIETMSNGMNRYDTVCTTLGEGNEQIVRVVVIDDGVFHYVISTMADAQAAGDCIAAWNEIFSSIEINIDQ